jgi:hypothetical protein
MHVLEEAFEARDPAFAHYLDTESGKCLALLVDPYDADMTDEMEAEIERVETAPAGRFFPLGTNVDFRPSMSDAKEFVRSVQDDVLRQRLVDALAHRHGAFRRFLDTFRDHPAEVERWHHFRRQRVWTRIAAYLNAAGVPVSYDPPSEYQPRLAQATGLD